MKAAMAGRKTCMIWTSIPYCASWSCTEYCRQWPSPPVSFIFRLNRAQRFKVALATLRAAASLAVWAKAACILRSSCSAVRSASPTVFCTERGRVRGPISVAAADVVAFFSIVCTSTRSKLDLAVESLGVTLLTHCAVRINRPKTEHVSRTQNAGHVLTERTTDRQKQREIMLFIGKPKGRSSMISEANCLACARVWRQNAVKHTYWDTPRRTTRYDVQSCQVCMSCCPGKITGSWMLCPARSVLANPSAIYVHNAIFAIVKSLILECLLRSNLSKRSKKHQNRKAPTSQMFCSPNVIN